MSGLSYHGGFILAAYAVTAIILAAILLWILLDGRAQKRRLAALEARGIRRRSAGGSPGATSAPMPDPSR